ncbi:synaptonemal complex central element protein 3 [Cricetulus griseus]
MRARSLSGGGTSNGKGRGVVARSPSFLSRLVGCGADQSAGPARVQATWMAYDMVVMRTNPTLAESMRRLEDAFLNCKEEMEKNWQELLTETKRKQ